MILLYVLLSLLALILLILVSNIVVEASYDDNFKANIRFWFIKFSVPSDKVKKSPSTKKKVIEETKTEENKPKKGYIKKLIEEKGFAAAIGELFSIVKSVLVEFGNLSKHIRISRLNLLVSVASDDPAVTAIEYGTLCSVVFPILRFIEVNTKLNRNKTNVSVVSDFETDKPKFQFNFKIKLRVFFALVFALNVLFKIIKSKMNAMQLQNTNKQTENKN